MHHLVVSSYMLQHELYDDETRIVMLEFVSRTWRASQALMTSKPSEPRFPARDAPSNEIVNSPRNLESGR
ncbi:MAG: hypothetical protein HC933_07490 [Pleurocapsa sp. SU_196_0]|nr:hypothetical protein [Pleurocapsa sp. SU_196_0]